MFSAFLGNQKGRDLDEERRQGQIWKEHMDKIMNKEKEWDEMVKNDVIEGPMES